MSVTTMTHLIILTKDTPTILIGLISLVVIFYIISAYNKGITLRNYISEAFSTMYVLLKKR